MEIPSFYLEQMYNNYSLLFEATRILYKIETGITADQNKTGKLQSTTLSRYGLIPCFHICYHLSSGTIIIFVDSWVPLETRE